MPDFRRGQPVTARGTVKVDDVLTDPTGNDVSAVWRKPSGAQIAKAATRDGVGEYSSVLTGAENDAHGIWRVKFVSTQANAAGAGYAAFRVLHDDFD